MDQIQIKYFIESALLAAGRPLSIDQLQNLFDGRSVPDKSEIRTAINGLLEDYEERGITITEVASGFRVQVKIDMADRLQKLWEERPPRYSRALFETLALIAYRQPMTRGEIEEIRGVAVSSNIVRSLLEREWIRVVGHRDVPGRPAMFGTTKLFLDYFGLKKLDDLPPLADLSDWESLRVQLNLPAVEEDQEEFPGAEITALPVAFAEHEDDEEIDDEDVDLDKLPSIAEIEVLSATPAFDAVQESILPEPATDQVDPAVQQEASDDDSPDISTDADISLNRA